MIVTYDYDTLLSFAQIINTALNAKTEDELRESVRYLPHITIAHLHFKWGVGKHHFWLSQRKELRSEELLAERILIVKF